MARRAILIFVLGCAAGGEAYLHGGMIAGTIGLRLQPQRRRTNVPGPLPCHMQRGEPRQGDAAAGDREKILSRRAVLAGCAAVSVAGVVPHTAYAYDFTKMASGDAVFDVPAVWIKTAEDKEAGTFAFSNPVSGKVLDLITVHEYAAPAGIKTTKDVGKIEKIKPSQAFGATKEVSSCSGAGTCTQCCTLFLFDGSTVIVVIPCVSVFTPMPQVDVADMVAAAVRKGTEGGVVFYDFDFAIAPKTCTRENEMLTGSCMYTKVGTTQQPHCEVFVFNHTLHTRDRPSNRFNYSAALRTI